jgi:hypothetical protein
VEIAPVVRGEFVAGRDLAGDPQTRVAAVGEEGVAPRTARVVVEHGVDVDEHARAVQLVDHGPEGLLGAVGGAVAGRRIVDDRGLAQVEPIKDVEADAERVGRLEGGGTQTAP